MWEVSFIKCVPPISCSWRNISLQSDDRSSIATSERQLRILKQPGTSLEQDVIISIKHASKMEGLSNWRESKHSLEMESRCFLKQYLLSQMDWIVEGKSSTWQNCSTSFAITISKSFNLHAQLMQKLCSWRVWKLEWSSFYFFFRLIVIRHWLPKLESYLNQQSRGRIAMHICIYVMKDW